MHRRARHLNLRSAGATLVLDSRFIAGSDGDLVSTWADRSGGGLDATSSGASRPTLKTGTNGLNGNNAVLFSGAVSMISSASATQPNTWLLLAINNSGDSDKHFIDKQTGVATPRQLIGSAGGNDVLYAGTVLNSGTTRTTWGIRLAVFNGASSYYRFNGVSIGSGNAGTTALPDLALCRWSGNNTLAVVSGFPGSLAASLRKRAEHSLALSFKLSCS